MIENSTELLSQKLFEKFPDELYRHLSLTARLAVALNCFSRYCNHLELRHVEIDAFLDDLWEFPLIDYHRWEDWEANHPPLVDTALGGPWPDGMCEYLQVRTESVDRFRDLLSDVAEIVFCCFYGKSDDALSMKYLSNVVSFVGLAGVRPPPPEAFNESRFADGGGWGDVTTPEVRDRWRSVVG